MALEGTIKDFGLADILQLIGIQRKTGILTMENDADTVTVKFLEGQVVAADTRQMNLEDLLGTVLVRTGRITESQLQEALTRQKATLQRLGYILVKTGAITEEDLREALRIQVSQIVYRLFRWREGRYHFAPAQRVDYDTDHFTPVGAETILMEGARMIDEWPILERRIRTPQAVFRRTAAGAAVERPAPALVDDDLDFDLSDTAKSEGTSGGVSVSTEAFEVLRLVDGHARVQDVVDRSPLSEFDVYRILCDLLTKNLIEDAKRSESGAAAVAAAERSFAGLLSMALVAVVLALALGGVLTAAWNPLRPWRIAGVGQDGDLLKFYAGEGRLERIEKAVQVLYFDLGVVPETLDVLVNGGYLSPSDLLDPWGRPYEFTSSSTGYAITGRDAAGRPAEELRVYRTFTATQRLLLGSALER